MAPEDRSIEVIVPIAVETLDPRDCFDAVSLRASRLVHAGLSRIDPETLEPVPLAARSWHWASPTALVVELRNDLYFSSGNPLSAADVVATWEGLASPTINSRHRRLTDALKAVTIEGPLRVRFELSHAHATLLSDLEMPILEAADASTRLRPWRSLAGLGPFRLATGSGDRLRFEPRDGGVLPRPARAIVVQPIHDENARVVRLASGHADVAFGGISTRLFPALEANGITLTEMPGSGLTYLLPRTDQGPLSLLANRLRLSAGLDRSSLVRDFLEGHARPSETLFAPSHWVRALAGDGAPPALMGPSAPLQPPGAPAIPLRLLVSADRSRRMLARFLQQELARSGFAVTVVPLELGTFFARLSAGDFDVALLNIPDLIEPNVLRVFMHSTSIPPLGSNRGRVHDPALDAILDAGSSTLPRSDRARIYAAAEAHVLANAYWIPLWQENVVTLTSPRASSLRVGTDGRWLGLAALP